MAIIYILSILGGVFVKRYRKMVIKTKKFFMNAILFISIAILGACLYKMYTDIEVDATNTGNEIELDEQSNDDENKNINRKRNISEVVEEVIPTVVGISKLKDSGNTIFLENSISKLGLGTGVLISENGYILTNQHVVGNKYSSCYVTLEDGKFYDGNVVWADSDLDLAIVKINAHGLNYISLGDSDALHITDKVFAIGNPIGLEFQRTVTAGIISGINRTIKIDEEDESSYMEDLVQTDATINPGNSGGPLINENGEMIAINSVKIISAEGIGFAIPINIVKPVIEKFINDGKFEEAYLGIFAYDKEVIPYLNSNLKLDKGIYVAQISKDGPAKDSDLKVGDVILKIDGQEVNKMSELRKTIYQKKPNEEVTLTINRSGKESEVKIILGRR